MAVYRATADWSLTAPGEDFLKGRYGRGHAVSFEDGPQIPGTASHHVVGTRWAAPGAVDPEQMLVASLATCHMLSFLHVAREAGFIVTGYRDEAEGVMEKNPEGRLAVTRITLRPAIAYEGRQPTPAERDHLHHLAHEVCFIANSIKTEVVVQERQAVE
ncbi:OsmC family peroxiredoxin [Phenylobacterium hankyongense]|uniref:OsmC family peroxiredoxin n=1 Tax=Phenylobacterium hankyongense TaxID=1813876 RepID=A0A328AZA5_9CAUL|nr:OsmC family protein [Phenylobacterium hankyongense]RAK59625.1 OsmC family peroxiredoxin [Phenylobacterium hankyongense]